MVASKLKDSFLSDAVEIDFNNKTDTHDGNFTFTAIANKKDNLYSSDVDALIEGNTANKFTKMESELFKFEGKETTKKDGDCKSIEVCTHLLSNLLRY